MAVCFRGIYGIYFKLINKKNISKKQQKERRGTSVFVSNMGLTCGVYSPPPTHRCVAMGAAGGGVMRTFVGGLWVSVSIIKCAMHKHDF